MCHNNVIMCMNQINNNNIILVLNLHEINLRTKQLDLDRCLTSTIIQSM